MNKGKIITGIIAYLLVLGIYLAFFTYPVQPATANTPNYKEVKSEVYSTLPYVVYKIYVRGSVNPGILLVATVRTPFLPDSTYSKILRSMGGIIENETKKRYNADIDLQFVSQLETKVGNHSVVMDTYDMHLKYFENSFFRPDTLKLYFGAFFCNENYESIIVAFVAPPIFENDFQSVMNEVKC